MKFFIFLITLTFTVQAKANCDAGEISVGKSEYCLSYEWIKGPFINARGERNMSEVILTFRPQQSLEEINFENIAVYPWMIMAGGHEHGARPVILKALGQWELKVENILLTKMHGDWFLRINLDFVPDYDPKTDYDAEIAIVAP